jgi:hypothetical protein
MADSRQGIFEAISAKQALIVATAAGAALLSYFVLRSTKKEPEYNSSYVLKGSPRARSFQRRQEELRASSLRMSAVRNRGRQPNQDRSRISDLSDHELVSATSGMKVIYFDCNDIMYSEEEVQSKSIDTKGLTKMVVRIAENERKRL